MSYNSARIELLRSLLFTLYIQSLCASRRVELAIVDNDIGRYCTKQIYTNA